MRMRPSRLGRPETHDVIPLAGRVALPELDRGKRAAVRTACTRGLAAAYATNVSPTRSGSQHDSHLLYLDATA
jgi:hypothetical protein